MARKGLGQGLGALLGSIEADVASVDGSGASAVDVTTLGIDKMAPSPFQPRQQFDPVALEQLAQSLASNGMLQPILVRPAKAIQANTKLLPVNAVGVQPKSHNYTMCRWLCAN